MRERRRRFAGTTHQGRIIALIGIHILAQMRLGWLSPLDDTPVSVSGETKGPGDDARVEFGVRLPALEVQAKHSLTAGKRVDELLAAVQRGKGLPADAKVIVAVGRHSSGSILEGLASDLDRLRTGRADDLKAEAARLVLRHGAESPLLRRIYIVPIDVDGPQDPEAKVAMILLSSVLEDPEHAFGAWKVLAEDGDEVCGKRLSRTRKDLVDLLTGVGIKVKPPAQEDRWHRQLDFAEELVRKRRASTALSVLAQIEDGLREVSIEPVIVYRLWQLRSAAFLQTQRPKEALESSRNNAANASRVPAGRPWP